MKPAPFDYDAPTTLDEALEIRARFAARSQVLAGGQSLMPLLNFRLIEPELVLDINRVTGLDSIRVEEDELVVGAAARQRQAERSSLVREHTPLLAAALPLIAHPAIRNRGTVVGSIAYADPAAELPAAALALDATIVACSRDGGRRPIAARAFFVGDRRTALRDDEMVVEVRLPSTPTFGVAVREATRRHGNVPMVGVATGLALRDGVIAEARVALQGAAETPIRADAAEATLVGQAPSPALFARAAADGCAGLSPPDDIHASGEFRQRVAASLMKEALAAASEGAHHG